MSKTTKILPLSWKVIILSIIMIAAFGFTACLTACFTACGGDEAKIVGIWASVVLPDEEDNHSTALADKNTLTDNDYLLQVGKTYNLTVTYAATGGSKYPGFTSTDGIVLTYDTEALEITPSEQDCFSQVVRFDLKCKCTVSCSAILIDVDGQYSFSVIISAN